MMPPSPVAPPPPPPVPPLSLPKVGDILFRAHSHVSHTSLAQDVVSVHFAHWRVVRTTKYKMWLAKSGIVQPREALPGKPEENCVELTEAQVMDRIRDARHSVEVRSRTARIMFAWQTKEEALNSLRERTAWRVHHARRALDQALAVKAFLVGKTPDEADPPAPPGSLRMVFR